MGRSLDEDPLTLAIAPPPDETYEQRQIREAAEAEAKRISDEIDEQIRKEREAERRKKKPVKLLLLGTFSVNSSELGLLRYIGQSESGKTATLKSWFKPSPSPAWLTTFLPDFQLTYARREWYEEKAAWRAVIFLNLVRNVNEILAHLTSEMSDLPFHPEESHEDLSAPRPPRALPRLKFTDKHSILRMRLGPLSSVQQVLEKKIGTASLEPHSTSVNTAAPFDQPSPSGRRGLQEFSINSSNGWKSALDKFRTLRTAPSNARQENGAAQAGPSVTRKVRDSEEEIVEVIASCREDIKALWEDDMITETLNRRKVRLEDAPGL
jgi:guanine nucleotide-binding protein subunit alpha